MTRTLNMFRKIIRDTKGVSSETIITIMSVVFVGALTLTIIIPLFISTAEGIKESETAQTEYDKVTFTDTLSNYIDGSSYGGDVIGAIRYFEMDDKVTIVVTNMNGTHNYVNTTYDSSTFEINLQDQYELSVLQDNETYTTQYLYTIK